MNALKFQQDTLAAYMKNTSSKSVAWLEKDTDHVVLFLNPAISVNPGPAVALFLHKADVVLDLSKMVSVPSAKSLADKAVVSKVEGNLLTPTEEYRIGSGNKKVRIYQARAWRTGIDQSLLKYFDLATMRLYQMEDRGAILITEKGNSAEVPVGIVMPCRI